MYSRLRTDWSRGGMGEAEAKLREFCKANGYAFFLLELDPETDYRDHDDIHISDSGQRKLALLVEKIVSERWKDD